jgi:hypothetical protein
VRKRLAFFAAVVALTTISGSAGAGGQDIRTCDFEVKTRCVSGDARVTLADGKVTRVEVDVIWCNRRRGAPGYTCMIDSSRDDGESKWSEDTGTTVITDSSVSPDRHELDRIKVTVGPDVTIDLSEALSRWRCGAGAELPQIIVVPAQGKVCRVRLSEP